MKKLWGSVGKRGLAFILSVTIVVTLIPNLGGIAYAEDDLSQTQSEQQADQSKDAGQDEAGVVLENDQGEAEQPSQDATTEDDSSQEVVSPQPEEGGGSDAPAVEEEKTESEDSSGSSAASSDEKEKDQTKEGY